MFSLSTAASERSGRLQGMRGRIRGPGLEKVHAGTESGADLQPKNPHVQSFTKPFFQIAVPVMIAT